MEIRENGVVGSAQTDDAYAPAIGFHWGQRSAASLIYTTSGFKFMNQSFTGYQNVYGIFKGNADTATKLQTARTINGTSFDGTANITTANWGTARTITLAGSVTGSVSINGSSNVTINTVYTTGAIAALDNRYVNVSGDTMSGRLDITTTDPAVRVLSGSSAKTAYGWRSDVGSYLYNYPSGKYLSILDNGTPAFGTTGNYLMMPYTKRIGDKADYQYVVILLWEDAAITTHRLTGKLFTQGFGGNRYQAADVDLWFSRWSSTGSDYKFRLDTYGLGSAWALVTCTYGGKKWWALRHTNIQAASMYFQGTFSNVTFTKVLYYTTNPATVNNSEINGSIVDMAVYLTQLSCGTTPYALVTSNVSSATKLLTARTLWGQSFNGTANVSGNMTGVGSITASGAISTTSTLSVSSTSTLNGIVFAKAGLVANNGTSISGWSGAGVFAGASTYPLVIYGGNGNANTRQYYFSVSGNSLNFSSANDSNAYVTKIVEFRHAGTVFWPHAQYYNNRLIIANDGKITPQSTNTRRSGMYGIYDSTKIGHIWSIGASYMIPDDGATFGNLYGLAYKHTNNSTGGTMAGGHQMVWCENGVPKSAMGTSGVWSVGYVNSATLNVSSTSTFGGYLSANGGIGLAANYGIGIVATANNTANIHFQMADNDFARILVGGASNNGFLEIATADDGTEPIHVRQYSGVFSSIVRTLTLLDGNGNTSIPNALTVGGYIRTNSYISAGEFADDAYGYINVTRPNNINNVSCFSMVRSGTLAFGIGFDTSNRIVMGSANNNKTINPWISISSSVTGVANGFECSYIAVRGTTEASSGGGSITTSGGIWASKSIFSGGAITAKYTSDKNLKCDFNYSVDYRQKIMDLGDVVDFRYNNLALQRNKGAVDTKRHTGVIYQKAVKAGITGLCLPKDEDGFGSVNPLSSDLIFTVIGAMQATIRSTRSFESRFERMERELREAKEEIVRLRQEVFRRA